MKREGTKILACISILCMLFSCNTEQKSDTKRDQSIIKKKFEDKEVKVKTVPVIYGDFNKELVINGKLKALRKAELRFKLNEIISTIHVKNGTRIPKGKVIAQLEEYTIVNDLQKSKNQLDAAKLEYQDLLIGYGYDPLDTKTMDPKIVAATKIKSGYNMALTNYNAALYKNKHTKLIAPFNGIIANLAYKPHQEYRHDKPFCLLIDNSTFEVEFSIIDSEFPNLTIGQNVKISPYSLSETYVGKITEINPFVDENGLIKVKATIANKDGKLLEGMSVKINIQSVLKAQIIVPKSAVVLRSEKEVVFTYKNKKANWNYVEIASENTTHYTIQSGLDKDDQIITEGNLSLSHGADVFLENIK